MSPSRSRALIGALIAVLSLVAGLLVMIDGLASGGVAGPADELQELVGGLGCGPAVDLSRCIFSFDPRLCPDCPLNHDPVPGGIYFCPQHACSILFCPPLAHGAESLTGGEKDGRSP